LGARIVGAKNPAVALLIRQSRASRWNCEAFDTSAIPRTP